MAVRMTKGLVHPANSGSFEDHFRLMHEFCDRIGGTAARRGRLRAFREKWYRLTTRKMDRRRALGVDETSQGEGGE
jgi:hypothetical protein